MIPVVGLALLHSKIFSSEAEYDDFCFPDGRSSHPRLREGAALQISLCKFQIDYYPYHLARGNRKHWPKQVALTYNIH